MSTFQGCFDAYCIFRRKKPAGAVSMFGGVDLFGGGKKKDSEKDQSDGLAAGSPQSPPVQPKTATKPKPKKPTASSGGLFSEGDEDEEDIFSFAPSTGKQKSVYYHRK